MFGLRGRGFDSPQEIKKTWFRKNDSVGICGATSTLMWLMNDIGKFLSPF